MDYYLRIQKSIDYIEDNLCENISLAEVSKQAYSSLSHFHRIFAFTTGFTIKEYIRKRRMSVAAHELLCTSTNVLDIALNTNITLMKLLPEPLRKPIKLTLYNFEKQEESMFYLIK